jgi:predicted  nucleic acid-binding Zn-ribbon protein
MTVHPQIALLLELQEVDQEIGQLQAQLNRYPVIWEEVKAELRKKTARVEEQRAMQERRHVERRKTEQDLRISSEKLRQYQSQQMLVKTGKELTAISGQIDTLKKTIARLEERGLQILEEDPQLAERIAAAEAELGVAKEHARTERERIRQQVAAKKDRIEFLRGERDKILPKLAQDALGLYERVRLRWPERPVVPVRNGSCTGCNFALLPNKLVDLHKNDALQVCDNCGRILSEDETYQPDQQQTA